MNVDVKKEKQALLQTDIDFSRLSVEKGVTFAFHHYLAKEGLVLPFLGPPRTRSDYASLLELTQAQGEKTTLEWSPEFADVARSGDLGYTWGGYTYRAADSSVSRGFYVTIWKKQANGEWRVVFDAGNQIGDKEGE